MRRVSVHITGKFNNERFYLDNHACRVKSEKSGAEIWAKMRSLNRVQLMANIPEGTLEKYKHCRPELMSWEWGHSIACCPKAGKQ